MKQLTLAVLAAALVLGPGAAVRAGEDAGETPRYAALKARSADPADKDIDPSVTLGSLLSQSREQDWSSARAARVEGYVIQVESETDGDVHVVLAATAHEPDTRKWVIAEVTRAVRANHKSMSAANLRKLVGKSVSVTGWLYWEPDDESDDPRGTRWELHPITAIAATGK